MKKFIPIFIVLLSILASCKSKEKEIPPTQSQLCKRVIRTYPVTVTGIEKAEKYCREAEFKDKELELRRNEYLFIRDVYGTLNSMNSFLNFTVVSGSGESPAYRSEADVSSNGIKASLSSSLSDSFGYMDDAFRRIDYITTFQPDSVTMEVSGLNVILKGDVVKKLFPGVTTDVVTLSLDGEWGMPEVLFVGALMSGFYGVWEILMSQNLGMASDWIAISNDYKSMVDSDAEMPNFIAHVFGNYRNLFTWDKNGKNYYLKSRYYFAGMLDYLFGGKEQLTFPDGTTFIAPATEGLMNLLKSRVVSSSSSTSKYLTIVDTDDSGDISPGDLFAVKGIQALYELAKSEKQGYIINPFSQKLLDEISTAAEKIKEQILNYEQSNADVDFGVLVSKILRDLREAVGYTGGTGDVFPAGFVMADFGALYRVVDEDEFRGLRFFLPAWVYNGGATRSDSGYIRGDADAFFRPFDYIMMWEWEGYLGDNPFCHDCYAYDGEVDGRDGPFLGFEIYSVPFTDVSHFNLFLSDSGVLNKDFLGNVSDPTDAIIKNLVILPPDGILPPADERGSVLYYFDWQEPTLWGFLRIDPGKFPDNCKPAISAGYDETTLNQIEINGFLNCILINYNGLNDYVKKQGLIR